MKYSVLAKVMTTIIVSHNMMNRFLALVIALTIFSTRPVAAIDPHIPSHWTEGWVVANNIRMHYWRTGGEKPPLMMLHGYSDDGLCWTAIAKELEHKYDIILPDARGFGLTDPPSQSEPADIQVEDLSNLIKALKLQKPILMGHSMGSSSVAWFSARHPEIPKASILVDPRLVSSPTTEPTDRNAGVEKRVADILARNNTSYEALFDGQKARNPHFSFLELHFWALSKQLYHPNTAYRSPDDRPSMSELFAKTNCPTLILKADDQGELREKNKEVAALLKEGQLVHVKDAGHSVHRDQPKLFLDALNSFLDKI
ncbi:MAG: alpha/beta hydrolase [Verrucomicrobia bacterium]|nr:alpha/beta hydrolase [Verrucomicrobiota bacterium]MDA1067068.1 alpha/beta hydrolase [Verrucomicrobiota bacterium]